MAAARRKASPPCPVSVPGDFFASLDGLQLYTFKEMFNFIDLDKDGRISEGDLRTCLARLGQPAPLPADQVSEMFEGHDNLNFTDFLAMFACRTVKDSENVLRKAFRCLDDTGGGKIDANATKELLTSSADRLTTAQVSQLFEDIAVDQEGKFDCGSVVQMLLEGPEDTQIAGSNSPVKHGADDKQGSTDK